MWFLKLIVMNYIENEHELITTGELTSVLGNVSRLSLRDMFVKSLSMEGPYIAERIPRSTTNSVIGMMAEL